MKEHIEKVKQFIKEKKVVENAKKYWWAILIGVLVLIYIVSFAFGGSGVDVSQETKISEKELQELSVTYIIHPKGPEATYPAKFLMEHIKPEETSSFINSLSRTGDLTEDIKNIIRDIKFSEVSDKTLFGVDDYWQTPAETLMRHEGDNEDWINTFVSSLLYYNPSFKCYVLAADSHLSGFCYFGNGDYKWMDQYGRLDTKAFTSTSTEQEKRLEIIESYEMFSRKYKLRAGEKIKILFAYNNKDFVQFANNEEFFDWAVALSK